jgi:hypothetical protein
MSLKIKDKARIIARQDSKCAKCLQQKPLDIHHIVFKACGGSNRRDNLMALCRECHDYIHLICSKLPHYKVHQLQLDMLKYVHRRYLRRSDNLDIKIRCNIVQYY